MTMALEGVRGQRHAPAALYPPGKDPVPIVQEAGWAPGPVWTGAENLAPTGIPSPARLARSESLYRLSYPAHNDKEMCPPPLEITAAFEINSCCDNLKTRKSAQY